MPGLPQATKGNMPKKDKDKKGKPKEKKSTGRVKCYALRRVLLSGETPSDFIKGQPLEISDKKFRQLEGADLVATKRPPLTEWECNKLEDKTGEKVKPMVKTSGRHALRG